MEVYPNSAIKASESGKAKLPLDYLQIMLTHNAEVPGYITPDLEECVSELQKQRVGLVALESDYFDLVSGKTKKPETEPEWYEWFYKVFKLYESSREWGRQMQKFRNWITEATLDNMKEGNGIMDVCRSERGFLLDNWSAADQKFEQLFCYAMLHGIPEDSLKKALKRHRENIPTFEKNLRELQMAPQNLQRSQPWINELKQIRAEIMASIGISLHQISQPLDLNYVFGDSARLRVFGHFLCQDISIILGEIEVLIEESNKARANELRIAQEQRVMYRY